MEILTKVFRLVTNSATVHMPANSEAIDTISQELSELPLQLSQVNRRWRFIAQHTPGLWGHIYVSHRRLNHSALLAHLMFSNDNPLDVTIRWLPSFPWLLFAADEKDDRLLKAIYRQAVVKYGHDMGDQLGLLLEHIERWRSVRVVLDDADMMESFAAQCYTATAPQLISLDLQYILPPQVRNLAVNIGRSNGDLVGFTGVRNSSLSSLRLDGVTLTSPLPSLQSLTTLKLYNLGEEQMPQLHELFEVLHELPHLRRLFIHSFVVQEEPLEVSPADIVCLPALEVLSISDVSEYWPEFFLEGTYFPNLKRLSLDIWERTFDGFLTTLHNCYKDTVDYHGADPAFHFPGSILGSIEGLQLGEFGGAEGDSYIGDKDEQDVFGRLINVRFLVLDVRKNRDHISNLVQYTRQLTAADNAMNQADSSTPSSTTCMPLLSTVLLQGIKDSNMQEIEDLVKTRKEMGVPIRRLLIQLHRSTIDSNKSAEEAFPAEIVAWLKANVEEVLIFDKEQLPNWEGIDDMLDVLFEVEVEMAAENGTSFVDVFRGMMEL